MSATGENGRIRSTDTQGELDRVTAQVALLEAKLRMRDDCFAQIAEQERARWRLDRDRLQGMRQSSTYLDAFRFDEPLVSVIIPTYNRAELILERTLPSMLRQDYDRWELLIVGDAMEDSQARMLRGIDDPRVNFVNLRRRGNYPARQAPRWFSAGTKPANVGLRLARGQWIAHLDDDDEFMPHHLGTLLAAARDQHVEWAHGKVLFADEAGGPARVIGADTPRHGNIARISSLYHACLKAFKYNINAWRYFHPGDWDLWERFLEMGVRHTHVPSIVGVHYGAHDEIVRRFGTRNGGQSRAGVDHSDAVAPRHAEVATLYDEVEDLVDSGHVDEAMERLAEVLHLDPDHALAHNDLGTLLILMGEGEQGFQHLSRAQQLTPDDWRTVNNLARYHQAKGDVAAALDLFRDHLARRPDDRDALSALRSMMADLGGDAATDEAIAAVWREHSQRPPAAVPEAVSGASLAARFSGLLRAFTANMLQGPETDAFVNACLDRHGASGAVPRVSLVIPVFNKLEFTRPCLESIARNSDDNISFEVIVVDNASSDGTQEFLETVSGDFVVWRNEENLGFGRATNQGAMLARGDVLVFLNNDTEVQPGWLQALVAELDDQPKTGVVGARLLYPDGTVQHAGVAVGRDLIPYHLYRGLPADHPLVRERRSFPIVTAACMAVRRSEFYQLGLLDEGFVNGHEDIDLCMRYRQAGQDIIYRPDCVAVHHESVSDGRMDARPQNLKRTLCKWRYELAQDDFAYRFPASDRMQLERPLTFAIKIGVPDRTVNHWGDIYYAECLARALTRAGHECRVHYLNEWGSDDLEVDVVIHLKGLSEYYPKPWNVNILWMLNHPDLHTAEELNRYDAVCVASESHAEYLRSQLVVPVFCLPQATDPDHFRPNPNTDKEFDLVFVGNNTGIGRLDMRQIVADVLPTRYKLAVWGDGWEGLLPDGVWKGEFVPWEYLPEIYSRARIVLNDHQPEMRDNGFVNNRTFDALACGAVVVSDDVRGLRRGLGVRTYRSRQELTRHIDQILGDETTAMAETEDLRQAVLQSFTFAQRVSQLAAILAQLRTAWDRTQSERGTAVSQLLANGPRVSVLMSTYNRRDLLSAAVESIRTQTYGNWELIVVNDGGEDVADLVAAAGDDRIRLINLPARRGKAAAVNVGFAASSGEYIAYLDDDDVWYTDHLQRLMLALTAVPGVRMAYSDAYNVSQQRINDGYVETDRQLIYHHQVTVGDLIAQNRIQGITVVHDRALFEEVGGMDPALRVLIDWDMWRRLAAQTYPYHVSRITADHFLREEAGTEGRGHITHLYRLNPIRYAQMRRRILRKELPLHRNSPLAVGLMHARVDADAELLRRLGEYYEERGRIAHGLRFYERAIERKSGDTAALRRLGRLHLRQGRPEQAVTCFWKCMHIQPTVEDYLHCAQAYLNMDLADDASACLAQLETQKCRMEAGLRDEVDRRQYQAWVAKHTADRGGTHEVTEYAQALGKNGPRFHVVATTNEPQVEMLADSLEALAVQRYPHWRLSVLAPFAAPAMGIDSDGRLRWLELSSAVDTETALGQVLAETGDDWVVMLRRGVRLHPNLFLAAAEHISRNPDCRLLYTDHDYFAPDGNRCDPQFKPDFNLELLRSQPYPGVACLVRADAAVTVGGLHGDGTEAWYDMALRVVECFGETAVGHVSEVLFHLPRAVPTSHSSRNESLTRDALEAHLRRCGLSATVENGLRAGTHAVFYHHAGRPKVTVIIPTRDRLDLVQPCVLSLLEKTAYINLEVLIVDNQSSDPATLKFMAQVEASDPRVRVLRYSSPYSYAAVNNFAAAQAQGDFLLLLNNDTVITQPEWLDRMLAHGQRPDVGVVGARLLFPDGRIQHDGVILGMGDNGVADHVFLNAAADFPGQLGRAQVAQELSAVTAACMLVRRDVFFRVGGFDDELAILYNDVDLCLKVRESGLRVIWTPFATIVHHGSGSLKRTISDERMAQYRREAAVMLERWLPKLARDPAYNAALNLGYSDGRLDVETDASWRPGSDQRPRVLGIGFGSDGSWRYRVSIPLQGLARAGMAHTSLMPKYRDRVRIPSVAELERMSPETVLMHNTVHEIQLQAMENYKRFNRATLVFSQDDLMTDIPTANPFSARIYRDMGDRLERAMGLCDRLVVTTEPLARAYRNLIDDIRVIPNGLDAKVWSGLASRRRRGSRPRVGWAGAQQHAGDLALIFDVVRETAKEIEWVFFGLCFEELLPYVAEVHNPVSFEEYPSKLAGLDLDLALAPLEINRFNEAKSNLRLLEYGALGVPVVCTDITPYQAAPVTRVRNTKQAWLAAIRERIADLDSAALEGDRLRTWVRRNWMLESYLQSWLDCLTPDQVRHTSHVAGGNA